MQFEYRFHEINISSESYDLRLELVEKALNDFAEKGWELATMTTYGDVRYSIVYCLAFKKSKQEIQK